MGVSWQRMEAELRQWALRVYFERTFAGARCPEERFLKALRASTRPVRSRNMVRYWYRHWGTSDGMAT